MTIRVFQTKLQEGQYPDDITPQRAAELQKELANTLEIARASTDEIKLIDYLVTALTGFYEIANEQQWIPVMTEFGNNITIAQRLLENMDLHGKIYLDQIGPEIKSQIEKFKIDLKKNYQSCKSNTGFSFLSDGSKFNLGPFSFPLTVMCSDRKLYVLRQPGDYVRAATTIITDGEPETRVFLGGKPIRLTPYFDFTGKQK